MRGTAPLRFVVCHLAAACRPPLQPVLHHFLERLFVHVVAGAILAHHDVGVALHIGRDDVAADIHLRQEGHELPEHDAAGQVDDQREAEQQPQEGPQRQISDGGVGCRQRTDVQRHAQQHAVGL